MAVSLVTNGEQTFLDLNGDPLAGGRVYFYEPNSTTPKTTWHDPGQAAGNPNPVVLDQAGRAIIWGEGRYRQVVQNVFGATQWDVETDTGGGGGTIVGDQTIQGNQTVTNNLTVNGVTTLNNGATINGSTTINGDTRVNGGLSASGSGGVAGNWEVGGSSDIAHNLQVGGPGLPDGNLGVWGTTDLKGPFVAEGGSHMAAYSGGLDALTTDGGIAITSREVSGSETFLKGQLIEVQAPHEPMVSVYATATGINMGMFISGVVLAWGPASGGGPTAIGMTLDVAGNLTTTGTVNGVALRELDNRVAEMTYQVAELKGSLDELRTQVEALRAAPPPA